MTLPIPDAAFHWSREPWGAALRCRPLSAATQHLFTSKQLALPSPEAWQGVTASLGSEPAPLIRVKQVHGNTVRIVRNGDDVARAIAERPEGDAIVSNAAGLALAVMVADCVPILVADPARGVAAAVHAGWRGTCARVAPTAIGLMCREFGADPARMIAAIGPSVGPDDYEVGEQLIDAFLSAGHAAADVDRWFIRRGLARRSLAKAAPKPHLDLWSANRDQLIAAGLSRDHIYLCGLSTVAHPDVFDSYRVAGERAGRMAGVIVVPTSANATVGRPSTS